MSQLRQVTTLDAGTSRKYPAPVWKAVIPQKSAGILKNSWQTEPWYKRISCSNDNRVGHNILQAVTAAATTSLLADASNPAGKINLHESAGQGSPGAPAAPAVSTEASAVNFSSVVVAPAQQQNEQQQHRKHDTRLSQSREPTSNNMPQDASNKQPAGLRLSAASNLQQHHQPKQPSWLSHPEVYDDPHHIHAAAKSAKNAGHILHSRRLLQHGLMLFPTDPWIRALAGSVESQAGSPHAAVDILQEGLKQDPNNIYFLTALGKAYSKLGRYDEARSCFQQVLHLQPTNAVALQAWGMLELQQHNYGPAISYLEQAVKAKPGMVHSYVALAQLHSAAGNIDQARRTLEAGSEQSPSHAPLLHTWAKLEADQDRLSVAKELLHKLLSSNARHLPSWMLLGQVLWRLGEYEQGRAAFARGSQMLGPCAPLLNCWAQLELAFKPKERAKELLRQALQADPRHIQSLHTLAQLEDRCGNTQASHQLYQQALQLEPDNVAALHGLAQSYAKLGNTAQAQSLLQRVHQLAPSNGYACHSLGLLAQQQGDLQAAVAFFKRGVADQDSNAALLNYEGLAELLAFQGSSQRAREVFERGRRARQPSSRYLRQYALFEKKMGNVEGAASLFADAVKKNPQDYKSWLAWAVFESSLGHFETAEHCFRCGILVAPGVPFLWYHYCRMLWRQGRVQEARQTFGRACKACPRHANLRMLWALMEIEQGDAEAAQLQFQLGSKVPPEFQHPPLYEAWARFEKKQGRGEEAERVLQMYETIMKSSDQQRLQKQNTA